MKPPAVTSAALEFQKGPSVFALTRQNLPQLEKSSVDNVRKGGYIAYESKEGKPDLIFVASGSEVSLAIDSAKELKDFSVRVVSMPCDGLFDRQGMEYRRSVIPPGVPSISIECLAIQGWERYSHAHIGMTTFGASAPIDAVMKKFGFTKPQVVSRSQTLLKEMQDTQKQCGLGGRATPHSLPVQQDRGTTEACALTHHSGRGGGEGVRYQWVRGVG